MFNCMKGMCRHLFFRAYVSTCGLSRPTDSLCCAFFVCFPQWNFEPGLQLSACFFPLQFASDLCPLHSPMTSLSLLLSLALPPLPTLMWVIPGKRNPQLLSLASSTPVDLSVVLAPWSLSGSFRLHLSFALFPGEPNPSSCTSLDFLQCSEKMQ